jgi:hypothetical protein
MNESKFLHAINNTYFTTNTIIIGVDITYLFLIDLIRSKGLEKISLDDLVEEMLPREHAVVPTQVKVDLLVRIKGYLEKDEDYMRLADY